MNRDDMLADIRQACWDHLRRELPPVVTDEKVRSLVDMIGEVIGNGGGPFGFPERGYTSLVLEGYKAAGGQVKSTPLDELELPPLEEIESGDRDRLLALLRKMVPTVEAPPNTFHVGTHADYVWIARPWKPKLSKADALSLAVYLAYLADPTMGTFLPLLQAVVEK